MPKRLEFGSPRGYFVPALQLKPIMLGWRKFLRSDVLIVMIRSLKGSLKHWRGIEVFFFNVLLVLSNQAWLTLMSAWISPFTFHLLQLTDFFSGIVSL